MNTAKNRIKICFNRAANTYDNFCSVQAEAAQQLITLLDRDTNFEHALDLGCGTGLATRNLLAKNAVNSMTFVDISENLLTIAKQHAWSASTQFINSDFDTMNFHDNYDLIISNMAMHWSSNLNGLLQKIQTALNAKGILLFSLPLEGSCKELSSFSHNDFLACDEILELMNRSGFNNCIVKKHEFNYTFASAYDALKSIQGVGANCSINSIAQKISKKKLVTLQSAKPFQLTYRIGCFLGKK